MRWFEQIERSLFARQFIKISDQSLQPRIDQNWFLRAGAGRKVDESWNRFECPSLRACSNAERIVPRALRYSSKVLSSSSRTYCSQVTTTSGTAGSHFPSSGQKWYGS